ncbi:MAG: DNA polymerase III, subunit gamma and tau [Gammaproteobacteria bacterium]|nr:DNA polymerase III, subunit gamma and tau [Gammaproteobacteria bacterium]|tara:strand:- start:1444 stop:3024 length:1581 start_codon:yes stop_codon:yes gene_type:complete
MSYLVLARKWRPKYFSEVSGQDHVVKALQNSLAKDKVHHAFLFSGTRGVGKTTIARLLAKALNCEEEVTSEPCGKCDSCLAIDEGNYVDLIEVDAATQTGIDSMRELIDYTHYMPIGRYKVYLIDEAHQLSKAAQTALLKTLEEPPEHMKFLLATTDSDKLPITVLSRCLKFNLKKIPSHVIKQRMVEICEQEDVTYNDQALDLISQSADGSMRDGLSLLDQALAFGDYSLTTDQVQLMLGTIDINDIVSLLAAVLNQDSGALNKGLKNLDEAYPNYHYLLDGMASFLQKIAFVQVSKDNIDSTNPENTKTIRDFSESASPELIQLLYQISITSKRDIEIAPSPREGFSMAMLRMFAFTSNTELAKDQISQEEFRVKRPIAVNIKKNSETENLETKISESEQSDKKITKKNWLLEVEKLNLSGALKQLVSHCSYKSIKKNVLHLIIDSDHGYLATERLKSRLNKSLMNNFKQISGVQIEVDNANGKTLAKKKSELNEEQMIMNESRLKSDPNIQEFIDIFDAKIEK